MSEALGDLFALDARIWRTLGPLVARPGWLTVEHFAGRRARHVPPLRLYVFAALVFFGVMAVTGGGPFRFAVGATEDGQSIDFGVGRIGTIHGEAPAGTGSSRHNARFQRWIGEGMDRVVAEPEAFNRAALEALSYAHFLVLPIFAGLLMLFCWRRYYVEHLVFAMHVHAFLLLLGSAIVAGYVAIGPAPEGGLARGITLAAWGILLGYLFFALRRAYGGRWWTTGLKLVALTWLYALAAGLVLSAVAFASILRF